MRFLLDVNVGSTIARALVGLGHDVKRAALTNAQDLDATLIGLAVKERRIIVSYDGDFGTLVFKHRIDQPPAIIYIRFEPEDVSSVLPKLLPLLDFDMLKDHITVIGPKNTRRTPFPSKSEHHG